jgi:hypothetical protein
MYALVVLLHVLGAFAFVAAHGVSMLVAFRLIMYVVATPFYGRMRAAAGVPGSEQTAAKLQPPATPADLDALATSNRPIILAAVGGIGLIVIVWLMVAKPF